VSAITTYTQRPGTVKILGHGGVLTSRITAPTQCQCDHGIHRSGTLGRTSRSQRHISLPFLFWYYLHSLSLVHSKCMEAAPRQCILVFFLDTILGAITTTVALVALLAALVLLFGIIFSAIRTSDSSNPTTRHHCILGDCHTPTCCRLQSTYTSPLEGGHKHTKHMAGGIKSTNAGRRV
jgi:hypothetical protein